jgi:ABC-2 type transport system ATP-binding protein
MVEMLKISNLDKTIRNKKILNQINMNVDEGMIYGFIGHNGAGKTTTMLSVVGLTRFQSGTIVIDGKTYENQVHTEKVIGYLPENPSFYDYMTAKEYITYLNSFSRFDKPLELLEQVGLAKAMDKRIGTYSRGMKQRLGMAAAMIGSPKLLILDEPTSALDPAGRRDLFGLIKNLRAQGCTIVLSTHILDDIEKISDRIGIIGHGELLREGNVNDILSDYFHPIFDVRLGQVADNATLDQLRMHQWITDVSTDNGQLSLTVSDVAYAKKNILEVLYKSQLNVIGFELRQPSLEDVFMKEVQG